MRYLGDGPSVNLLFGSRTDHVAGHSEPAARDEIHDLVLLNRC